MNKAVECGSGQLTSDPVKCDGDHTLSGGHNCDDGNYVIRTITIGEDIDPNAPSGEDIPTEAEDGLCGYSEINNATYDLGYLRQEASIDPTDNTSWLVGTEKESDVDPDNLSTSGDEHFKPPVASFPGLDDQGFDGAYNGIVGKLYLDYDGNGIINELDDITDDGIPEAFVYGHDNANGTILFHIKNYLGSGGLCAEYVIGTDDATFNADAIEFWQGVDQTKLNIPEGNSLDGISLTPTNTKLIVDLNLVDDSGVPSSLGLNLQLIQQPSIMMKKVQW